MRKESSFSQRLILLEKLFAKERFNRFLTYNFTCILPYLDNTLKLSLCHDLTDSLGFPRESLSSDLRLFDLFQIYLYSVDSISINTDDLRLSSFISDISLYGRFNVYNP